MSNSFQAAVAIVSELYPNATISHLGLKQNPVAVCTFPLRAFMTQEVRGTYDPPLCSGRGPPTPTA